VDAERALVSKVAREGGLEKILGDGIAPEHFDDPEAREVWQFMSAHTRQYKQPPSLQEIVHRYPNFDLPEVSDALEFVRDKFVQQLSRREAIQALHNLGGILDDPERSPKIGEMMLSEAHRLSRLIPGSTVGRLSDMDKRIEEYRHDVREGISPVGIQMGIPEFDRLTLGIQPHEYISVVGWQGTGKSTLSQWMLFNAYAQGKLCMYVSLEMEAKALFRKWDTMCAHFEYKKLKSLDLTAAEISAWEAAAARVAAGPGDILTLDDVRLCSVDSIYGDIVRYEPDLVCIDYISLMDVHRGAGNSMWEKITYLTQSLKQVSRTAKVPIIGVAQTNIDSAEGGAKLTNISYARSIGQDSDIVLGLHSDEKMKENRHMEVRLLKNRDGRTTNAQLFWDLDHMEFRERTSADNFQPAPFSKKP